MTLVTELLYKLEEMSPEATLKSMYDNPGVRNGKVAIVDGCILLQGISWGLNKSLDRYSSRHPKDYDDNYDAFAPCFTVRPVFEEIQRRIHAFAARSWVVVFIFDKGPIAGKIVAQEKRERSAEVRGIIKYRHEDYEIDTRTGMLYNKRTRKNEVVDFERLAISGDMRGYLVEYIVNHLDTEEKPLPLNREVIFDYMSTRRKSVTLCLCNGLKLAVSDMRYRDIDEADLIMLDWMERYRETDLLLHSVDGDWIVLILKKIEEWHLAGKEYGHITWANHVPPQPKKKALTPAEVVKAKLLAQIAEAKSVAPPKVLKNGQPSKRKAPAKPRKPTKKQEKEEKGPRRSYTFCNVMYRELIEHHFTPHVLMTAAILCENDFFYKKWCTHQIGVSFVIKACHQTSMMRPELDARSFEAFLECIQLAPRLKHEHTVAEAERKRQEKEKQAEEDEAKGIAQPVRRRSSSAAAAAARYHFPTEIPLGVIYKYEKAWETYLNVLDYWDTGVWAPIARAMPVEDRARHYFEKKHEHERSALMRGLVQECDREDDLELEAVKKREQRKRVKMGGAGGFQRLFDDDEDEDDEVLVLQPLPKTRPLGAPCTPIPVRPPPITAARRLVRPILATPAPEKEREVIDISGDVSMMDMKHTPAPAPAPTPAPTPTPALAPAPATRGAQARREEQKHEFKLVRQEDALWDSPSALDIEQQGGPSVMATKPRRRRAILDEDD